MKRLFAVSFVFGVVASACSSTNGGSPSSPTSSTAPVTAPPYTITGSVSDVRTGEPVRGVTISTCGQPIGPNPPPWDTCGQAPIVTTDSNGSYSLAGLPAGVTLLSVSKNGYNTHMDLDIASATVTRDTRRDYKLAEAWSMHGSGNGTTMVVVPAYGSYGRAVWRWGRMGNLCCVTVAPPQPPATILIRQTPSGGTAFEKSWPPTSDLEGGSLTLPAGTWEVVVSGTVGWSVQTEDNVSVFPPCVNNPVTAPVFGVPVC